MLNWYKQLVIYMISIICLTRIKLFATKIEYFTKLNIYLIIIQIFKLFVF